MLLTDPEPDPSNLDIAVIGGSLVGPAAELFLRRAGFRHVTTYEAMSAAHSQSGGVMGLRQHTLSLLTSIGVDVPAIEALPDRNVYAFDVTPTGVVPRGVSAFPGVVSSWDALHTQLRDLVDVQTRRRLVDVMEIDGRWQLDFADGSQTHADVALFADGRNSFGRKMLDPGRPLRYNGYVVWRGLVEPLDPAPQGFQRYYDIRHGRLFSVTAPLIQSGRSYWELSHNLPADVYERIVGGTPTERAFMLPGRAGPDLAAVVDRAARHLPTRFRDMIARSEIAGIPVNDRTMPDRALFRSGRAVAALLGDALLPVRLQVGAGLNMGLIQAADVAVALREHTPDSLDRWQTTTLAQLAPIVELGRSRAHRNNLGYYEPVQPGRTAAPPTDQWAFPQWVTA